MKVFHKEKHNIRYLCNECAIVELKTDVKIV
jgi:hypothetical protein